MATYTTRNRLAKTAKGEARHTWADNYGAMLDLVDFVSDGRTAFALSGSKTLTTTSADPGTADEARSRVLHITSGTGGTVTIPNLEKVYHVINDATGEVTFTVGSGTTCKIGPKRRGIVYCTGSAVCYRTHLDTGFSAISSTDASSSTGATITLFPDSFSEFVISASNIQQSSGGARNLQMTIKRGGTTLLAATTLISATSGSPYNVDVRITHTPFQMYVWATAQSGYSTSGMTVYDFVTPGSFGTAPAPDTVVIDYSVATAFSNGAGVIKLDGR